MLYGMVFLFLNIMALISFNNPAFKYKWFNQLWITALLIFPIALWLLPADMFDHTGVEICPSKFFFDFECLGCGMTRATMHLHHFEWQDAIYYNYGIVVIYPLLVIVWAIWLRKAWKRQVAFQKESK
jgi:hypothetical protein